MARLESTERKIATVARGILDGEVGIVEGCRLLVQLRARLDVSVDESFLTIIAVASETEDLPIGALRSRWSKESLARTEAKVSAYITQVRGLVLEACEALVEQYSPRPKYRVLLNGQKFLLKFGDEEPRKRGFYQTHWREARNPEEAEAMAVQRTREDQKLRQYIVNEKNDSPIILLEEIEEIEHFDDVTSNPGGFAFYLESVDENGQ